MGSARSPPRSRPSSCTRTREWSAGEAVRRGGERLVRESANVTARIGTRRRRDRRRPDELRARIAGALREELGPDGLALRVVDGDDGTITVRGEVGTLEEIRHASEVIERARGDAEVVNLIRLRAPAPGGAVTG